MISLREYLERFIVARLSRRWPDETYVSDREFREMASRLDVVMFRILEETALDSFSEDDLESFMLMKLHQMMRRSKFDPDRGKHHQLAYVAFRNLMRDILLMERRALSRGLGRDALPSRFFPFSEANERSEENRSYSPAVV